MSAPEVDRASSPVLTTLLPGFTGTTLPDWLARRLRNGLGGVCLFGPNIESPAQLRALTDAVRAANPEAVIALDEEGGDVTRIFAAVGSPSPGNAVLGRLDDLAVTRDDALRSGWALRRAGANVNFAPSVDVNSRSDNPVIGVRSFGATADQVARHGAAWVAGLQSTGVAATAKHFPGHGDTGLDSHVALPVVDRSLDELHERELVPFAAAIAAGVRLIMTSHLLLPQIDPENPATMSRTVLVDLLRGELGFTGVVVSDALDMAGAQRSGGLAEAAVRALSAGCDLLCLGTENTEAELAAIERAVEVALAAGTLGVQRVREAAGRVHALAGELAAGSSLGAAELGSGELGTEPAGSVDLAAVVATFDVSPRARTWVQTERDPVVVRLEAEPNLATGPTPWGPFAVPGTQGFAGRRQVVVSPASGPVLVDHDHAVLVVGRDIHRHPFAREAVDRLRRDHDHVLVVDMGWPADDRRYADVATFGSSRLMGAALIRFLTTSGGS